MVQEEGIMIVTSGLVKVCYNEIQSTSQTYYIGVGGMFGLFSALTGIRQPPVPARDWLPWALEEARKMASALIESIGSAYHITYEAL